MSSVIALRRMRWLLLAIGAAVAFTTASLWASHFRYVQHAALSNVSHLSGNAYQAAIPFNAPSDDDHPYNSSLVLLQDGRPLGPAHADEQVIAEIGNGSFLVRKDRLVFSTSDNSDPGSNGHRYTIEQPKSLSTILLFLLTLPAVVAFCAAWYLAHITAAGRGRTAVDAGATILFIILCLELFSTVLLTDRFGRQGIYEKINAVVFDGSDAYPELKSFSYAPHHYLFYSLNAAGSVHFGDQIDATYLIRRKEAIRPRAEVAMRILAIGGSTTFDTSIGDEKKTWVGRLETRLRERYGAGYDVINGGVGGYTVYENMIHYITLLTYLDPDIVLLYEGINDVHPRLYGTLALDYRNYNRPKWPEGGTDLTVDRSIWAMSATYRFWQLRTKYKGFVDEGLNRLTRRPYPPVATWRDSLRTNPASVYQAMLENFVALVRAQGRKVVIIPQHFRPVKEGDEIFSVGVEEHNRVDETVAGKLSVPFLSRVGEASTFGAGDTTDNCHFSETGAQKMADIVYEFLAGSGYLSR
jgi:lysophospholipase L1-like esterase